MKTPFRFLTTDDLRLLEEKSCKKTFLKDEAILKEGHVETGLYVLLSGQVRVAKDARGDERLITYLEPGEVLGVISFLDGSPVGASLVAAERCECDYIKGLNLCSLLMSVPGLATRFYHSLAVIMAARLNETIENRGTPYEFSL